MLYNGAQLNYKNVYMIIIGTANKNVNIKSNLKLNRK